MLRGAAKAIAREEGVGGLQGKRRRGGC